MSTRAICGIAAALAIMAAGLADTAEAQMLRVRRIDIQYVPPKNPQLKPVYEFFRQSKALEKLQNLLAPLRLPRRLLLKTEDCDGVQNAWYDGEAVTVCYEFLDDIWKNMPPAVTQAGIAPVDALVGPTLDVFLHEVGHAVFDLWKVPLFGREEDAADQFSAYIMLQFRKEDARRLIIGNAFQYRRDLLEPSVTMAIQKFADEHGTPTQRFFNVLCLAYGADPKLFGDFVSYGWLPQSRSEACEGEYQQVAYAFKTLLGRYIDRNLARRLHGNWLPPVDKRPPRRPDN